MKFLVDTNVLSEVRKGSRCDASVAAWWSSVDSNDIFISILTIGELRKGVERARRKDAAAATSLEKWLLFVMRHYRDRVLTIDIDTAEEWGRLNVPDPVPIIDGLLAATAKVHGLTLVTRNISDVVRTGVTSLNPWH